MWLAGTRRDVGGGAGRDDGAAGGAAFGAEIDDPVRGADDVQVVLDHDHGVAVVDQAPQRGDELRDVGEMQARRRLVEQEQRAAGRPAIVARGLREPPGELQALRLAARQRRHRLAEREVVEADVDERLQARARRP